MNTIKSKNLWLIALLFMAITASAQEKDTFEPRYTEVWDPPVKVTSGEKNAPPSDAIILFDGKDLNEWTKTLGGDKDVEESIKSEGGTPEWLIENGAMTVKPKTGYIKTKQKFGDIQLHIEWRSPSVVKGEGQGRGNSGIFLMDRYELQILDSYESQTYSNGQAGSIYKQSIPLVNACKGPGEWQTYDVIFMAPVFTEKGNLKSAARITVIHNGVLIQNNYELIGPTQYDKIPRYTAHGKGSIQLQDHGDLVSYRNIWVREL